MRDEPQVFYFESPAQPLDFVIGFDTPDFISIFRGIKVIRFCFYLKSIEVHQCSSILVEEIAVCFEVNHPSRFHHFAVMSQEFGRGKPFALLFHLGIRKGNPDFADLFRTEEGRQQLHIGSDESGISQPPFVCGGCTGPDSCPLDIDAYKIFVRKILGKSDRVLSFSTAQFQNNRIIVPKKLVVPVSLEGVRASYQLGIGNLHHIWQSVYICKFRELVFTHGTKLKIREARINKRI